MMRPRFLLAVCVTAAFGLTPAYGQTVQERYVEQLKQQGFDNVTISRTWLGRTRITASSKTKQREIIFNTRSGEVLRDYWQDSEADGSAQISDLLDIGSSGAEGSGAVGSGGQSGGDSGAGTGGAGTGGAGTGGGGTGGGGTGGGGGGFDYLTGGHGGNIAFDPDKLTEGQK